MFLGFFHGGPRGLRVGDFILPPAETGKRSTSDLVPNKVHRRDRVYVATDINAAALYAIAHDGGVVYEVKPTYPLERDPDCGQPDLSFSCMRAEILAIHKLPGKFIKKARRALFTRPARG